MGKAQATRYVQFRRETHHKKAYDLVSEPKHPRAKRIYSAETLAVKRARRAEQHQDPLEKMIRLAKERARTAWNRGQYDGIEELCACRNGDRVPNAIFRRELPIRWRPVQYYSTTNQMMNGYEIRAVFTKFSPLVAVWGFEGIICVPLRLVWVGHRTDKLDPSRPPMCSQCDQVTYSHHTCMFCEAPLYPEPPESPTRVPKFCTECGGDLIHGFYLTGPHGLFCSACGKHPE